jgi:hypothetical protein
MSGYDDRIKRARLSAHERRVKGAIDDDCPMAFRPALKAYARSKQLDPELIKGTNEDSSAGE